MIMEIGMRASVFFVLQGETKRNTFRWLVSWAHGQYHEAWAEFAGEMIKAGTGTTIEELETKWAHLPENQTTSGEEAKARP